MINLIGLTGLKQSGKTTAARYLRDTFAYHQADFASPIRSMVADMIGTTVEAMEQIKEQPHPVLGGPHRAMPCRASAPNGAASRIHLYDRIDDALSALRRAAA